MSSDASEVLAIIRDEPKRSRNVADAFLQAQCLLEMHYTGHPSPLLEVCPQLRGQTLSETEAAEINQALLAFVEEVPAHECVPMAIKILALPKNKSLRRFFVDQLRKHVAWRSSTVVFQLLLALEDLGEAVFLDAQGRTIQFLSINAVEVNLDAANRYLNQHDKSR